MAGPNNKYKTKRARLEEYYNNPNVQAYLAGIRFTETGGTDLNWNAKNPKSTARGPYQFLDSSQKDILNNWGVNAYSKDPKEVHLAALGLMAYKPQGLESIKRGDFKKADTMYNKYWTSLPGGAEPNVHTPKLKDVRTKELSRLTKPVAPKPVPAPEPGYWDEFMTGYNAPFNDPKTDYHIPIRLMSGLQELFGMTDYSSQKKAHGGWVYPTNTNYARVSPNPVYRKGGYILPGHEYPSYANGGETNPPVYQQDVDVYRMKYKPDPYEISRGGADVVGYPGLEVGVGKRFGNSYLNPYGEVAGGTLYNQSKTEGNAGFMGGSARVGIEPEFQRRVTEYKGEPSYTNEVSSAPFKKVKRKDYWSFNPSLTAGATYSSNLGITGNDFKTQFTPFVSPEMKIAYHYPGEDGDRYMGLFGRGSYSTGNAPQYNIGIEGGGKMDPINTKYNVFLGLTDNYTNDGFSKLTPTFGGSAKYFFGGEGPATKKSIYHKRSKKADGGPIEPYNISDLTEFKRANKAYQDSLSLSKSNFFIPFGEHLGYDNVSELNRYFKSHIGDVGLVRDGKDVPVEKYQKGIQPVDYADLRHNSKQYKENAPYTTIIYKKPVRKPVYTPESEIIDAQGYKVPLEYLKKYPPTYTNNPKDPRIGTYGEKGDIFLYKKPIQPAIYTPKPEYNITQSSEPMGPPNMEMPKEETIMMPNGSKMSRAAFEKQFGSKVTEREFKANGGPVTWSIVEDRPMAQDGLKVQGSSPLDVPQGFFLNPGQSRIQPKIYYPSYTPGQNAAKGTAEQDYTLEELFMPMPPIFKGGKALLKAAAKEGEDVLTKRAVQNAAKFKKEVLPLIEETPGTTFNANIKKGTIHLTPEEATYVYEGKYPLTTTEFGESLHDITTGVTDVPSFNYQLDKFKKSLVHGKYPMESNIKGPFNINRPTAVGSADPRLTRFRSFEPEELGFSKNTIGPFGKTTLIPMYKEAPRFPGSETREMLPVDAMDLYRRYYIPNKQGGKVTWQIID